MVWSSLSVPDISTTMNACYILINDYQDNETSLYNDPLLITYHSCLLVKDKLKRREDDIVTYRMLD